MAGTVKLTKEQLTGKDIEGALTPVHEKVVAVKKSISGLVGKMEAGGDQLNWPSVLDSFSTLSGQTSTLMRQLSSDKFPPIHNRVILPLQVSSDRDCELERNTEGRISIVHHEVVPNYMRTKLDLDLEAKQKELAEQVADKGVEINAEIKKFNDMLSSSLERVTEVREELDDQKSKTETAQSRSSETRKLVAFYLHGSGLTPLSNNRRGLLSQGRLISLAGRSAQGRVQSAMRAELKQTVNATSAPYTTTPAHRTR